jgi:hypothetical protein
MHFKTITTQLYDPHKGNYDIKVNKDNTQMNPRRIVNEREGWMNCIQIWIFVLSGSIPSANFLSELLSTLQKLSTHRMSSAHTARRMYFAIAHKNSSWVVPLLPLLASPYSIHFKQTFSRRDNKYLQQQFFRTLVAF